MAESVMTQAHNGQSAHLKAGDVLTVKLPESPTTGYRWAVDRLDGSVLKQAGSDYQAGAGSGLGGGGTRSFWFVPSQAGIAQVELKLWREWEGDRSVTQRYRLQVHVA